MASNFDCLLACEEWSAIYQRARQAEQGLAIAPEMAAIFARSAMELGIKWVYHAEGLDTNDPYHYGHDRDLYSLLNDADFAEVVGDEKLLHMLNQLRLFGNAAAHGGRPLSREDGVLALRILFEFCQWLLYCYTQVQPQSTVFDESILPRDEEEAVSRAEIAKQAEEIAKKDEELAQAQQKLLDSQSQIAQLQAELQKLRQERQQEGRFSVNAITEAETRRRFIDYDLELAGWHLGDNCEIEQEVSGMPNASGQGFADYVLYGRGRMVLAIVEAKRTSLEPDKGAEQAKLYADYYQKKDKEGRRPFIFLTNGLRTLFLDGEYPRRRVSGFLTQDDLQMRMDRRGTQAKLSAIEPDHNIAGRPYQLAAVKAVEEALDHKRRKCLLVQATGTGKTRVAISIVKLLCEAGWAKRVLFLADRTALVKQAKRSFQELLKGYPMASMLDSKEEVAISRIVFSTYPTMMNAIDAQKDETGKRLFSPGTFDLIVIDESHRSIYRRYQAIFHYFDAFLLGLTATPKSEVDKNTYRQFELEDGNPTYEYSYEEAVKEGYLVPYEQFERTTNLLAHGVHYRDLSEQEKEHYEDVFGVSGENAPDINSAAFNKYIFNRATVKTVLEDLRQKGQYVAGGDKLGKTIIFAKNRRHAKFIVDVFHELYPELGDDFIARIDGSVDYYEQLLDDFRSAEKLPQIAVSVDMLDTGIDVPEILNLVFFKTVRSYSKFWQMIGRGTRLCKDLFGPGMDKQKFSIFDYGNNFEYFSVHGEKLKGSHETSLTERIFHLQLSLFTLLKTSTDEEQRELAQQIGENLQCEVKSLDRASFRVQEERAYVERYRQPEAWENLSADDMTELEQHIAPLVTAEDKDFTARLFDQELYGMMLKFAEGQDIAHDVQQLQLTADRLSAPSLQALPQVRDKSDLLQEVRSDHFTQNLTVAKLEQVRAELRGLLQFLTPKERKIYYTDFQDTMQVMEPHEVQGPQPAEIYRRKVEAYLQAHQDNLAVYKLRTNHQLTASDWRELERVLWQELGTQEDYAESYGDLPIGKLVRQTVGMDRASLEAAFADFLQDNQLNLRQLDFVRRIIDYLAKNGTMQPKDVQKSAFKEFKVAKLFQNRRDAVQRIFAKVAEISANSDEAAG